MTGTMLRTSWRSSLRLFTWATSARLLAACLVWLMVPSPAAAQTCTASATTLAFGTINTVYNRTYDTTSTVTVTCSGTATTQIRLCPYIASGSGGASANGPRQMSSGVNKLNFDIYTDQNHSQRWANDQATGANPETLITTAASGPASTIITLYGQIAAAQTGAAVGSYTSSFSSPTKVTYGYASSYSSCSASGAKQTSFSFQATANNSTTCAVSTLPVAFGAVNDLNSTRLATGAVRISCAPGTTYAIALDGGANGGTSAAARKMANGSSTITYGLYRDSSYASGWFNDAGGIYSGTADGSTQSIPVYGRVLPQATPAGGAYADLVVVTVTY